MMQESAVKRFLVSVFVQQNGEFGRAESGDFDHVAVKNPISPECLAIFCLNLTLISELKGKMKMSLG